VGTPVRAAAPGRGSVVREHSGCGLNIFLEHRVPGDGERLDARCTRGTATWGGLPFKRKRVSSGVKLSDMLASQGRRAATTRTCISSYSRGLHHDYITHELGWTENPVPLVIGCFISGKSYPIDRFVLTWPLEC